MRNKRENLQRDGCGYILYIEKRTKDKANLSRRDDVEIQSRKRRRDVMRVCIMMGTGMRG